MTITAGKLVENPSSMCGYSTTPDIYETNDAVMMSCNQSVVNRRNLLKFGLLAGAGFIAPTLCARSLSDSRELYLTNLHTGEQDRVVFFDKGYYVSEGLDRLAYLLRDHRNDEIGGMDPRLYDTLSSIQLLYGNRKAINIISGYRSPKSNEWLREHSDGVAKASQHTLGKAIDFCIPKVATQELYKLCCSYRLGGVGRYLDSGFVHMDTARVRYWG